MIRKLLVAGAIVTATVAMVAGPAFAHVEIEREGEVTSDGTVEATLTVPNEEADAGTVTIALVFPESPGITDAEAAAVDGWTASVEKSPEGDVTQVVWTGGPLTGEEEVELPLTLGPLPDGTDELDFKAVQTYDDGQEVRWIEPTPEGGEEPEHPAPVLLISGEAAGHDDAATDDHAEGADHDDGLSTGAIVAIVAGGVIVLALVGWGLSRRRRDAGTPTG